jgi:hypothetical protein
MNIINDEADNEQEQRDWLKFRLRGEAIRRLQLERMRRLWLEEMRRLRLREVRKQLGPIFDRVAETKKIDKGCMMKTAGIRGEIDDFDNSDRVKKNSEAFFRGEFDDDDDDDDSDNDIPKFGSYKSKVKKELENRLSETTSSSSSPAAKKVKKMMITDVGMDPFDCIDIEALTSLPTDKTSYL